jgi:hypothetical protein
MRLIDPSAYRWIYEPLVGKRVGYVRGEFGNVGDTMQEKAVWQLCRHYGIDVQWLGPVAPGREPWDWELSDGRWGGSRPDVDHVLLFGGGNMGLPGPSMRTRAKVAKFDIPMTVLPNSWRAPETLAGDVRYFMRESSSARFSPEAMLAPDSALALEFDESIRDIAPTGYLGIFLRDDREGRFAEAKGNRGAPFMHVGKRDIDGYLSAAARFHTIATDALHFAIAGIMAGRRVFLLPGTYHKNWGMYDCWLRDMGCNWAERPTEIR